MLYIDVMSSVAFKISKISKPKKQLKSYNIWMGARSKACRSHSLVESLYYFPFIGPISLVFVGKLYGHTKASSASSVFFIDGNRSLCFSCMNLCSSIKGAKVGFWAWPTVYRSGCGRGWRLFCGECCSRCRKCWNHAESPEMIWYWSMVWTLYSFWRGIRKSARRWAKISLYKLQELTLWRIKLFISPVWW